MTTIDQYRDILGITPLNEATTEALLSPVGFADQQAAGRSLYRLAAEQQLWPAIQEILPHLLSALPGAGSPDQVLLNFERFAASAKDSPGLFSRLSKNPRLIESLVTLLDSSQFLTEILLFHPNFVELLADHRQLARSKDSAQFFNEASASTASMQTFPEQQDALRRYQRRELLRIGACDVLDLYDLPTVTQQLSDLAEGLIRACLGCLTGHLKLSADGFAVIAMGKLGGKELNYSSDIDLLFVGRHDTEKFRRLGETLIESLSKVTSDGFLYRVDMRLRPWGKVGALVPPLNGYLAYVKNHARIWEKQSLLKARIVAGDESLGNELLIGVRAELFGSDGESIRAGVHSMKQRTEDHLRRLGRQWGEVKLGEGSIRDVEFITQYLQLTYGSSLPQILCTNTLQALERLFTHRLLSTGEYRVLEGGYIFLRTVEHHLQMMHYQQTHRLPGEGETEALSQLARRLGFLGPEAGKHFVLRYQQHCTAIRAVYLDQIGNGDGRDPADRARSYGSTQAEHSNPELPAHKPDIPHHLLSMHPSYAVEFHQEEIAQHAELAGRLDDERLVEVDAAALDDRRWRVTIVAYDFPGELSLICGLLFVYNLNILDGRVFTYEPPARPLHADRLPDPRRKIVDVFTVQKLDGDLSMETWSQYKADLAMLLQWMNSGQRRKAQAELAKRVALALPEGSRRDAKLYPIQIEIDNTASGRYTILRIESHDTPGFLYEVTNSLAYHRIYISRMRVDTVGTRVEDTLYVTNASGSKITAPEKLGELRAAIVLIKHFTHLLPLSPNPESALVHFRELIDQLFKRPNWLDDLASLERPEVLRALAKLLGISDFLWDDFLRMQYANLFPVVRDVNALTTPKTKEMYQDELASAISASQNDWRATLNAFKDRELFRVDMRNILGYTQEFGQFSNELTDLAEAIIAEVYQRCFDELAAEFGKPELEDGRLCPMSVCALGKCGGRELGFASDIELLFIYQGNGQTEGPVRITTAEFYEKLVQAFLSAVRARQEGIFHIDLQLRPYGKAGSMAVSRKAFRRYYALEGPAWAYERQALVKLRLVAGDVELGQEILSYRDEFVYSGQPFDVTAMRAMRERQIRHFVSGGTFNAKFSPGGLLDVEYLVQGLQITYGDKDISLRAANTRDAMAALAAAGVLSPEEYVRLRKALTFLRWLIDSLRVVRGNAKDLTVPPAGSDEFAFLARRLRYEGDFSRLSEELNRYTTDVLEINHKLLG
jgi:glutamate-ammonia-ligase adenylyltransferase